MPKENILVKDDLPSKVKEESIDLFNKRKEETKEVQRKLKKYPILHIKVNERSIGLLKIENHQDENTIACIDKIYKESFNKFIDFRYIVKFVVHVVGKIVTIVQQRIFLKVQAQRTIKCIPTTCTSTTNENLDWTVCQHL